MCEPVFFVLVVDDTRFTRGFILGALQALFGSQIVLTTVDGLSEINKLDLESFDLVLADLKVYGGSGLEVLYTLRRMGLKTPFVLLVSGVIEEAFEEINCDTPIGNFDILMKPFGIVALRDLVAGLITTPALCD